MSRVLSSWCAITNGGASIASPIASSVQVHGFLNWEGERDPHPEVSQSFLASFSLPWPLQPLLHTAPRAMVKESWPCLPKVQRLRLWSTRSCTLSWAFFPAMSAPLAAGRLLPQHTGLHAPTLGLGLCPSLCRAVPFPDLFAESLVSFRP